MHVAARSVFLPVDQVISDEELLVADGYTIESKLSFGSDRYDEAYVGRIDPDGNFGVLLINHSASTKAGSGVGSSSINALLYRWQVFPDPNEPTAVPGHLFLGPKKVDAKEAAAMKLSIGVSHPPFPLTTFVFGSSVVE